MSEFLEIHGGTPLNGTVLVSGAKNAALPLLIASLLTREECRFERVPNLEDVNLTVHLLEQFGGSIVRSGSSMKVSIPELVATEASYSLVKALRASFWILAPLLARGRAARVALPGGDIIGARPVDIHLEALRKMGAEITVKHGIVYATAVNGLRPCEIDFRFPSVGATHQIVMAAALTPGTTVIRGVAREPEVVALCEMIRGMGGDIEGDGGPTIVIRGKEELRGTDVNLIGDRVEAGTYLLAGVATGGKVVTKGVDPLFFGDFLNILSDMGVHVVTTGDSVEVSRGGTLKPVKVRTGPFPMLATDLHPPLMAALTLIPGESSIEESVYEGRYGHVSELCRMGAQIKVNERVASITGVQKLYGAPVEGHDIRAAASVVVGALAAEGVSQVFEIQHLRRGYDSLESKLRKLGGVVGAKHANLEDFIFTGC